MKQQSPTKRSVAQKSNTKSSGDKKPLFYDTMDSPVGAITIITDESGRLYELVFAKSPINDSDKTIRRDPEKCRKARTQIEEYFKGKRNAFDIEFDLGKTTTFQQKVWNALSEIPFGETRTYLEIAKQIGRPRAYRAVGNAAGANPIPICIPCHRLVASHGKLGGYSGGLDKKRFLLELEKRINHR